MRFLGDSGRFLSFFSGVHISSKFDYCLVAKRLSWDSSAKAGMGSAVIMPKFFLSLSKISFVLVRFFEFDLKGDGEFSDL